jgi:hypothetical protein
MEQKADSPFALASFGLRVFFLLTLVIYVLRVTPVFVQLYEPLGYAFPIPTYYAMTISRHPAAVLIFAPLFIACDYLISLFAALRLGRFWSMGWAMGILAIEVALIALFPLTMLLPVFKLIMLAR